MKAVVKTADGPEAAFCRDWFEPRRGLVRFSSRSERAAISIDLLRWLVIRKNLSYFGVAASSAATTCRARTGEPGQGGEG